MSVPRNRETGRTLQALMPLMRAATQLRLVLVDVRDPRRTLQIVINHRLREKNLLQ